MNPVHDSLSTIRETLEEYQRVCRELRSDPGQWSARQGLAALQALQDALSANHPLAAVAEAFCSDVERTAEMVNGTNLANGRMTPLRPLVWYAREFRAAMERKPEPAP